MAVTSTQAGGLILVGSIVLLVAFLLLGVWSSRARPLDPRRARELLSSPLDPLPPRGLALPVGVIFSGASGASAIAMAKNSFAPGLVFYPDRFAVRVVRRREIAWREVREVTLAPALGAPLLVLHLGNGEAISARLQHDAWRIRALRLLERCGVTLGTEARRFLQRMQALADGV